MPDTSYCPCIELSSTAHVWHEQPFMWKARYAAWGEGRNWQARSGLGRSLLFCRDACPSTLSVFGVHFSTVANSRNSSGVLVKAVPSRSSRVPMTVMRHHKRHHLGLWLAIMRARRYGNSSANATLLALCVCERMYKASWVAIADRERRSLDMTDVGLVSWH